MGAIELIAFVFAMFTVYGCGPEPVLYGFVLLLLGIPVYVWQRRAQSAVTSRLSSACHGLRAHLLRLDLLDPS